MRCGRNFDDDTALALERIVHLSFTTESEILKKKKEKFS